MKVGRVCLIQRQNLRNFELYRFKVGALFETHSVEYLRDGFIDESEELKLLVVDELRREANDRV